jgi:protein-S-isoprenylcysteine O-methyltransferase Ste14
MCAIQFIWAISAKCWALTALAIVTGTVMVKMEDEELENRFGEEYRQYRSTVPAVLPLRRLRPLR